MLAVSALEWSVTGMGLTVARLAGLRELGGTPGAFAAVADAVWSVTMVDAALVREYPDAYDLVVSGKSASQRRLIKQTLAGLRFVRNRIGGGAEIDQFVDPDAADRGAGVGRGWVWRSVPEPTLASLAPRARAWERVRYEGYRAQLAGKAIEGVFDSAVRFLELTAASARSIAVVGVRASG